MGKGVAMGTPSASIMGGSMGMPAQHAQRAQRGRDQGEHQKPKQASPLAGTHADRQASTVRAHMKALAHMKKGGMARTRHAHVGAVGRGRPLGHLFRKLVLRMSGGRRNNSSAAGAL